MDESASASPDDSPAGSSASASPDDSQSDSSGPSQSDSLGNVYRPVLAVAGAVLLADVLTKQWADDLEQCAAVPRKTFNFCLAYNEGMAFSFGWGSGALIAVVAIAIVVVLLVSARRMPLYPRVLMGVIAGGAVGNVLDRAFRAPAPHSVDTGGFMRGAVIDFLYTSFWPTFNVADSAIVVGGILLAIALWRLPDPEADAGTASADGSARQPS